MAVKPIIKELFENCFNKQYDKVAKELSKKVLEQINREGHVLYKIMENQIVIQNQLDKLLHKRA